VEKGYDIREEVSLMGTNYEKLIHQNLSRRFEKLPFDLEKSLGAEKRGEHYYFRAFGEDCYLSPDGITLSNKPALDPRGLLVSLYAIHANPQSVKLELFKSFKDLPDSMPYHGAFSARSEMVLIPHVLAIRKKQQATTAVFNGHEGIPGLGGDFSFVLYPLPKIALSYIFYLPDEEFPASANCLFSANALSYMPVDGLADVAEYTSKGIIQLVSK
jgi:hypothetical protein